MDKIDLMYYEPFWPYAGNMITWGIAHEFVVAYIGFVWFMHIEESNNELCANM